MPKEEWGVKRLCPVTNKRFYDLGKDPIVSPYTGEVVTLDTGKNTRVQLKSEKKPEVEEEEVLLDDEAEDLAADADVDLEDDVLDDDDDDSVSLEEIADVPAEDND